MYVIIRIIVHAKGEEEAMKKAEDDLKQLVEKGRYDYYRTFERNDKDGWKGDWNHLPPVVLATSPEGKHFIEKGWQYTVKAFTEHYERVKFAMQYLTPEHFMERIYPEGLSEDIKEKLHHSNIRCYFHDLSQCEKSLSNYLYFEHEPITDKSELEWALKPEEGLNVYVIPADAHW